HRAATGLDPNPQDGELLSELAGECIEQVVLLEAARAKGRSAGGENCLSSARRRLEAQFDLSFQRERHGRVFYKPIGRTAVVVSGFSRTVTARTNTYIVKHSSANTGNPKYPGNGISKIFTRSMIGTL